MLDIRRSIKNHYPELSGKVDKFHKLFKLLDKLLHTEEINRFISKNQQLTNFLFLDAILKEFSTTRDRPTRLAQISIGTHSSGSE